MKSVLTLTWLLLIATSTANASVFLGDWKVDSMRCKGAFKKARIGLEGFNIYEYYQDGDFYAVELQTNEGDIKLPLQFNEEEKTIILGENTEPTKYKYKNGKLKITLHVGAEYCKSEKAIIKLYK